MPPACRALTSADYPDVLALLRELTDHVPVLGGDAGASRYAEILAHPGTTMFGAVADGVIVAIATLHLMPNLTYGGRPYGLVENVVTKRSHQGQGFGRAVMQMVIKSAWAADAYKLMLLTGQDLGARGFYEGLGFVATEKHAMTMRRVPPRQARA